MRCPACTQEIEGDVEACPACGAELGDSYAPTRILPEDSKPQRGRASRPGRRTTSPSRGSSIHHTTSDSLDRSRFVAGTILNERYRVVGLLGRGGMGEVYRAEDLTLGQTVALKFLPETLSSDGAALSRFHREVRVARQISHRNVCRVYDIGDAGGLQFLSMEYVRGEELSSVLKRFGRLPADKATEIARQLCAGLAAAHDAGVLHRDLKPANVMIDENGDVRITDFGLAGLLEEFGDGAALEGTPEYMSPEQLGGRELTARSDIYSLGLVLYELYTGRKAFTAATLAELLRLRKIESRCPTALRPSCATLTLWSSASSSVACRPTRRSARPRRFRSPRRCPAATRWRRRSRRARRRSPEMVAAAPKQGSLRPPVALAFAAGALALFALCFALSGRVFLHTQVPLEKTTDALRDRAQEIAKKFGYESATDSVAGFNINAEYLQHVETHDQTAARWGRLKTGHPAGIVFWYRQSPRYLAPFSSEEVTPADPPRTVSGMANLSLDTRGRLLAFEGVPPQTVQPQQEGAAPARFDWARLFAEAGLDPSDFRQVEPVWVPPHPFDERGAWEGTYPGQTETTVRVEAAAFRGRPVYYQLINPWNQPMRQVQTPLPAGARILQAVLVVLFFVILCGAGLLARHNLRLGRGDHRGALRLAGFVLVMTLASWVMGTHHVPVLEDEFANFVTALARCFLLSGMLWLVYVALEPYVRRRWPGRIIGWNRLLAGDWRDPLVGRDLLLGAFFGCALTVVGFAQMLSPEWMGRPPLAPAPIHLRGLFGVQYVPNLLASQVLSSMLFSATIMFLLLLLTIIMRRERVAVGLLGLIMVPIFLGSGSLAVDVAVGVVASFVTLFVLLRFGMLALVFTQFFLLFFNLYPITSEVTAWYAGASAFAAVLGAALILYGFKSSLAGRPLFRGSLLND